jgi:hypothetical protein
MYSVLVLGSDWFTASVIRTIKQANHFKIKEIKAATKLNLINNFNNGDLSSTTHERYLYGKQTQQLFPTVCRELQIPIEPFGSNNGRGYFGCRLV